MLTVTHGSSVAKIILFGQYAGTFHVATDGAATAGSLVTYTPPAALAAAIAH